MRFTRASGALQARFTCASRALHVRFTSASRALHARFTCALRALHVRFTCALRTLHVRSSCASRTLFVRSMLRNALFNPKLLFDILKTKLRVAKSLENEPKGLLAPTEKTISDMHMLCEMQISQNVLANSVTCTSCHYAMNAFVSFLAASA